MKRLGELSILFASGTCGTYMIDGQETILFCFNYGNTKGCKSFIRKNNDELKNINNFLFNAEFQLTTFIIPDSKYEHYYKHGTLKLAKYKGYPLILGGNNAKLEMLITAESFFEWNEQTDYPYATK